MWDILIGILLILHGLIFIMFLVYVKLPEENQYFGWSRKSWLLDKILGEKVIKIIGLVLWSFIIGGFVASGIVLLTGSDVWSLLTIITSFVSLLSFLLFWPDLQPKPKNFILGPIIAVGVIIALLIFQWPTAAILFG
ncbi:MAG: hypothetical protein KGD64_01600 [Candidatus Heimdallarchaeota archaeon]|nr:hypothetical protein [Candidatus Heimdallarchaeota archaeon]